MRNWRYAIEPYRTLSVLMGMLLTLTTGVCIAASATAAEQGGAVDVSFDQDRITTVLGRVLTLESRITNPSSAPSGGFVAHLNVTSLDGVYVDLEDWSADVTREVTALAPWSSRSLSWDFQAVNAGSFKVYVVLLPEQGSLVASPPVRVEVAKRRTLDAGGALPVIIVVPLLLALLAAASLYRVRRAV